MYLYCLRCCAGAVSHGDVEFTLVSSVSICVPWTQQVNVGGWSSTSQQLHSTSEFPQAPKKWGAANSVRTAGSPCAAPRTLACWGLGVWELAGSGVHQVCCCFWELSGSQSGSWSSCRCSSHDRRFSSGAASRVEKEGRLALRSVAAPREILRHTNPCTSHPLVVDNGLKQSSHPCSALACSSLAVPVERGAPCALAPHDWLTFIPRWAGLVLTDCLLRVF